ncbi:Hypothetical_protein [Hexamita inflata]|uniref:Hypothetical_protein n=1 Tax=Hexamita inflata TaxID=28002 RepID=A0AA86NWJ0_9EUKA|nr:Hypothetical protein HINF_LOCUS14182 [Hexamita inflata]
MMFSLYFKASCRRSSWAWQTGATFFGASWSVRGSQPRHCSIITQSGFCANIWVTWPKSSAAWSRTSPRNWSNLSVQEVAGLELLYTSSQLIMNSCLDLVILQPCYIQLQKLTLIFPTFKSSGILVIYDYNIQCSMIMNAYYQQEDITPQITSILVALFL